MSSTSLSFVVKTRRSGGSESGDSIVSGYSGDPGSTRITAPSESTFFSNLSGLTNNVGDSANPTPSTNLATQLLARLPVSSNKSNDGDDAARSWEPESTDPATRLEEKILTWRSGVEFEPPDPPEIRVEQEAASSSIGSHPAWHVFLKGSVPSEPFNEMIAALRNDNQTASAHQRLRSVLAARVADQQSEGDLRSPSCPSSGPRRLERGAETK